MQKNPFGVKREHVLEGLRESSKAMRGFIKEFKEEYDVVLSGKVLSELYSNLLETICARVFSDKLGYEVKKASSDNDSDLFFTKINMPMEIKVTSGQVWRGGEFSKRASWHLMVSRDESFENFFVCLVDMKSHDGLWESSMQKGKDYYAPNFKKDQIYELKDEVIIFVGDIEKDKRSVKLSYEKIN